MTNQTATKFKVICDDGDYFVADATVGAYSFAMVTKFEMFTNRKAAEAFAKKLNQAGEPVEVMMFKTPNRFEAVADTKYGCAWE